MDSNFDKDFEIVSDWNKIESLFKIAIWAYSVLSNNIRKACRISDDLNNEYLPNYLQVQDDRGKSEA